MKLSELDTQKSGIDEAIKSQQLLWNEIESLRDWRRETAQAIKIIDEGGVPDQEESLGRIYVIMSGDYDFDHMPDIHKSAWPALRGVLDQTLACIEADLQRLGVEIDEPALFEDAAEDDEAVA